MSESGDEQVDSGEQEKPDFKKCILDKFSEYDETLKRIERVLVYRLEILKRYEHAQKSIYEPLYECNEFGHFPDERVKGSFCGDFNDKIYKAKDKLYEELKNFK